MSAGVVTPITTGALRHYFAAAGTAGSRHGPAPGTIAFMSFIAPLFLFVFFPLLYAACLAENTCLLAKKWTVLGRKCAALFEAILKFHEI